MRKDLAFRVLRVLLRPAVRFCLARSFQIQELLAAAKLEFLARATDHIERESASISRLSAATGLQRKDIARLRQQVKGDHPPQAVNLITRVVGLWEQAKRYRNERGIPRPLTFSSKDSEFAQLVRSVNSDLSHHTILRELERCGVIKRDEKQKRVILQQTRVITRDASEQTLLYAGRDGDDLFRAVEANISSSDAPVHLHARTTYDNISSEDLPKIQDWLFSAGDRMHQRARGFLSKYDRDTEKNAEPATRRMRVTMCTFSFVEEVKDENSED